MSELLEIVHNLNRLAELRRTALLDTPPEEPFDRLTRLATRLCKTPVGLVSLVDRDRQFFKSAIGLPEPWRTKRETPLSHSFCKHAVTQHAAEWTDGDPSIGFAAPRASPVLQSKKLLGRFLHERLDGILIAQPVTA